jgi:plastocyanin
MRVRAARCARAVTVLTVLVAGGSSALGQGYTVTTHISFRSASASAKRADLSNFVAWLVPQGGASTAVVPRAAEPRPRLAQKDKQFQPHILVVPVGAVVEFPNRDPWFHNVFSLFEGKRFDLGLYEAGTTRLVHFDRAGISYIFCNIHPQMSAVVVTLETPYWAISNRQGELKFANVPPGRYALRLWGERAAPQFVSSWAREVVISADSHSLADVRVPAAPDQLANHKNKYGRDYDNPAPSNPVYPQP